MICCLNPDCEPPLNADTSSFCNSCGTELVAQLFNRFRVKKPIGQGGFSRTYLAEDLHNFDQLCVIKQLIYAAQGPQANKKIVELFMREAKQLQQLRKNQQIPDLIAYFEILGHLYLVQELIVGVDLEQELFQQGLFHEQKIKDLLFSILPVLSFIHGQGVIHRDIKPANIMRRFNTGELVIIDFGVSKQLSKKLTTLYGVTSVGTQGYASYEQFSREDAKPKPASDLFSLGATCFRLMTGILPGDLWARHGYSWCESWEQHLKSPVSPELSKLLSKLLEFDICERYQSASEVLEDLTQIKPEAEVLQDLTQIKPEAEVLEVPSLSLSSAEVLHQPSSNSDMKTVISHKPTPAKSPNIKDKLPKFALICAAVPPPLAQNKILRLILCALVLAAAAYILFSITQSVQNAQRPSPDAATTPKTDSEAPTGSATDWFVKAAAKAKKGDHKGAIADYDKAIELKPDYTSAYNNRGVSRTRLGDDKGAIADFDKAIELQPDLARTYFNRGNSRNNLGDDKGAIADFDKAIELKPGNAVAYFNRGASRNNLGDNKGAIADFDKAIELKPDYTDAYANRGFSRNKLGDYKGAIADYDKTIQLKPDYVSIYNNRGISHTKLGNNKNAIVDFDKAIELRPNYATAYSNRGFSRMNLGDNPGAIEDYTVAARLFKQQGRQKDHEDALKQVEKLSRNK